MPWNWVQVEFVPEPDGMVLTVRQLGPGGLGRAEAIDEVQRRLDDDPEMASAAKLWGDVGQVYAGMFTWRVFHYPEGLDVREGIKQWLKGYARLVQQSRPDVKMNVEIPSFELPALNRRWVYRAVISTANIGEIVSLNQVIAEQGELLDRMALDFAQQQGIRLTDRGSVMQVAFTCTEWADKSGGVIASTVSNLAEATELHVRLVFERAE